MGRLLPGWGEPEMSGGHENHPHRHSRPRPRKLTNKEMERLGEILGVKSLIVITGEDDVGDCDGTHCRGHMAFARSIGWPKAAINGLMDNISSGVQHIHSERCENEIPEDDDDDD